MSAARQALVPLRSGVHRLRTLFRRHRLESDLAAELAHHVELEAERLEAQGVPWGEARRRALLAFGGVEQIKEACRDERGARWLETLARDLRWSLRWLRRSPAFTLTTLAVLGLGLGAATAVFSLVHGILVEPLPFTEPDRLVALWESSEERGWDRNSASGANLLDWRDRAASFSGITAHGWVDGWALGGDGDPERVEGVQVLGDFFAVLGVRPVAGSFFPPEAHWQGEGEPTVVIAHELWRRRFAGDPGAIGRRIELDGVPRTVVGVAPPGFSYPVDGLDVWMPFQWDRASAGETWFRRAHFLKPVARLAPGIGASEAAAELSAIAASLRLEHPDVNHDYDAGLTPLHEWAVGEVRRPLLVLLAAVVLLLVVTGANVANLLLARSSTRGRELAVRNALGASRRRLVAQLACESGLLALGGGALGLALGAGLTAGLASGAEGILPRADRVAVDLPVVLAALAATVATAVPFALLPALRLSRHHPAETLASSGRWATAGAGLSRSRALLVAAEVALAVVLVCGAALTVRSFTALLRVDPGFTVAGLAAASFDLPPAQVGDAPRVRAFERELLARVRALSGVEAAALASSLPLRGSHWTADFSIRGRREPGIDFHRRIVSPGYVETMGARVLSGRSFTAADDERGRPVVVVNQLLARQHFGDRDPVGSFVTFGREPHAGSLWREIVGVVANEKVEGLAAPDRTEILVPLGQELLDDPENPVRSLTLVVRGAGGEAAALLPEIRQVVRRLDSRIPLYDATTLEELMARATARERLLMLVLALFAALALALAVVGLYGLVAYAVAQRRREIGLRLALGAGQADVVRAALLRGLAPVAAGLLAGLVLTLGLTGFLDALLFGIRPNDPATLAAAVAVLAAAGLGASLLPARRAARVDPMETLRSD